MRRLHALHQPRQIAFRVIGLYRPPACLPPLKRYAKIGLPLNREIYVNASFEMRQMVGAIDAFRGETPTIVTRGKEILATARGQKIPRQPARVGPSSTPIRIEISALVHGRALSSQRPSCIVFVILFESTNVTVGLPS